VPAVRRVGRGLVVGAVHLELVGADDRVELRAARDGDRVAGLVARVGLLVRKRVGDRLRNVLEQLAAQHDMQELLAAADA